MIETEIQKLTAAVTQLTVTAEALLETLRHKSVAVDVQPAAEEPAPAPKPKKAKAPKVEEPAPAPEPVKAEEPVPAAREYSLADLRDAAQKALDNGKLDDVVNLNKHYGVKRISEVPPELYGEIIAKLEALVHG